MPTHKIGVFLPHSKQHPTLSKDFINGLRLALPYDDFKLCIEGIGFGNNPEQVINIAQKFVNQEQVDLTTGILGHRGLEDILDYFTNTEETILYSDLCGSTPLDLSEKTGVYCNSLGLYEAAYSLGEYFINKGYKNISTSTCYYDAGYSFTQAMEEAFDKNNTTNFAGHFITPLNPRANEAELMHQFINETNPDAIFGFHNGIYAEEHASYLKQNKANQNIPLYTLPFSVSNKVLAKFPEIFNGTFTVSSWNTRLNTKENKGFIKLYQEKYTKTPNVFSVLGFENGLLIKDFITNKLKEQQNTSHKLFVAT